MNAFNEIHATQKEEPERKKPMTLAERAKVIEDILKKLEYLGLFTPMEKGGDHE